MDRNMKGRWPRRSGKGIEHAVEAAPEPSWRCSAGPGSAAVGGIDDGAVGGGLFLAERFRDLIPERVLEGGGDFGGAFASAHVGDACRGQRVGIDLLQRLAAS
jgi:hypothetical protein